MVCEQHGLILLLLGVADLGSVVRVELLDLLEVLLEPLPLAAIAADHLSLKVQ